MTNHILTALALCMNENNPVGGGFPFPSATPTPPSEETKNEESPKDGDIKETTLNGVTVLPGADESRQKITRNGIDLDVVFASKGRASQDHCWRPILKDEDEEAENPYLLNPEDLIEWLGEDDFYRVLNQALVQKFATDFAQKYGKDSDKLFEDYQKGESLFKKATSAKAQAKKKVNELLKDVGVSDLEKIAQLIQLQGGNLDAIFQQAKAAAESNS